MKTISSLLLCSLRVAAAAVLMMPAMPALADWDPDDPAKWVQLPDLSPNGMDVNLTAPKILADDWMCNDPRPVTDIHLWGSWKDDLVGENVNLIVQIWSDEPATADTYSHPKDLLWQPTTYTMTTRTYFESEEGEWWYDPNTGDAIPGGDHVVWQVNLDVSQDPFRQVPDTTYWLVVQAQLPPTGGPQVGWKTSAMHWNDDAVYADGDLGQAGSTFAWQELRYPPTHPFYPGSVDLAFVITVPEPGTLITLGIGAVGLVFCRRTRRAQA
jgi:hypothetical protein